MFCDTTNVWSTCMWSCMNTGFFGVLYINITSKIYLLKDVYHEFKKWVIKGSRHIKYFAVLIEKTLNLCNGKQCEMKDKVLLYKSEKFPLYLLAGDARTTITFFI